MVATLVATPFVPRVSWRVLASALGSRSLIIDASRHHRRSQCQFVISRSPVQPRRVAPKFIERWKVIEPARLGRRLHFGTGAKTLIFGPHLYQNASAAGNSDGNRWIPWTARIGMHRSAVQNHVPGGESVMIRKPLLLGSLIVFFSFLGMPTC